MKSYSLQKQIRERRRRRKKKILSLVYAFIFISFIAYGLYYFKVIEYFSDKNNNVIKEAINSVIPEPVIKKDFINDDKVGKLSDYLVKYPDFNVSVSLIDAESNKSYHAGTVEPFIAASTTKVLSGICYLKRVESGYLQLTDKLGSSTGEYQLKQMINRSNNPSWDLINQRIGYSFLKTCAKNLGASTYNFSNNTVSSDDMANILLALSRYELLSKEGTDLLLSYMQDTNEERMIPAYTPTGYTVYHKYGILGGKLHDIAIVKGNENSFIIAIYTDGPGLGEVQLTERLNFYKGLLEIIYMGV